MKTIVRMQFGSHLYGTSTPESDYDFKSVFIPSGRDILLGRVQDVISDQRPKGLHEKNYAGEVEEEKISLQKFLKFAAEGQTMAMDMLFAPPCYWDIDYYPARTWNGIRANRHRLLTKQSAAFIGYARQQANKYGIKGSRVAAARAALEVLNDGMADHGPSAKLMVLGNTIAALNIIHNHMELLTDVTPHGQTIILWSVVDRKMPYTASIKNARDIMARVVEEYGKRALMAETQQGVDWKALSHAVRVGRQAIELLTTAHVTFPRPEAAHLIAIKTGQLQYQRVAEEIEMLLEVVESAAASSVLPEKADQAWIDDFVAARYCEQVLTL